jgi:hypothetical protein
VNLFKNQSIFVAYFSSICVRNKPQIFEEEWHKIEQSATELPEQSPMIPALQDYMDLLDKLKVCESNAQGYLILRPKHILYTHTNFVVINLEEKIFKASFLNIGNLILVVILSFCGVTLNAFAETNSSVSDKATQNDLARLTNSDVTMTSQILRTLQKRGLVLREQIEGDERAKYSSLSPAGKKLVKKAAEIMKTNEKEYFAPVEKDMEQFLTYLKVLTRVKEINML